MPETSSTEDFMSVRPNDEILDQFTDRLADTYTWTVFLVVGTDEQQ